jgi:hypothetical protein
LGCFTILPKEHDKEIIIKSAGKLQALAVEMHRRTTTSVRLHIMEAGKTSDDQGD